MTVSRFTLAVVAVFVTLLGAFAGSSFVNRVDPSDVEDALVRNCDADRQFRIEYRDRAIVEKNLVSSVITANEAIIEVVNANPGSDTLKALGLKLDQINFDLTEDLKKIDILPLPDCHDLRKVID